MQLLRKILWPVSLLYGAGVYFRNWLYDSGLKKSQKYITHTISVGNLSLGGTGKTPMVEWLCRELDHFAKKAVLSRGYGRKSSGFILADENSQAEDIGDEPLQIYTKFPELILAVDGNRRRGISYLEKEFQPDVILLDDAFQHRKVLPSISILLTAHGRLYSDDCFLPTGTLRDSRAQANRADIIIVTKCPANIDRAAMEQIRGSIKPLDRQLLLFCTLDYSGSVRSQKEEIQLEDLRGKSVTLVTGIANPKPLLNFLQDNDMVVKHLNFRDHHRFTEKELKSLGAEEFILTTEKDYVRSLNRLEQAYYVEVRHRFIGKGKEELLGAILA